MHQNGFPILTALAAVYSSVSISPYKLLLFIGLAVSHKILLLEGTWQTLSPVRKIILNKFLKCVICIGALLKVRGADCFEYCFFFSIVNPLNKLLKEKKDCNQLGRENTSFSLKSMHIIEL